MSVEYTDIGQDERSSKAMKTIPGESAKKKKPSAKPQKRPFKAPDSRKKKGPFNNPFADLLGD